LLRDPAEQLEIVAGSTSLIVAHLDCSTLDFKHDPVMFIACFDLGETE
jgi:hypothetical protein